MNLDANIGLNTLTLTSTAAEAVKNLLEKRNLNGFALRVFVQGGGCSGFQYGMAFEENIREMDTVVEEHGVTIVIDEVSSQYLRGASIDYIENVTGSGFKIENPNVISSCGCGNSSQGSDKNEASGGCSGCG